MNSQETRWKLNLRWTKLQATAQDITRNSLEVTWSWTRLQTSWIKWTRLATANSNSKITNPLPHCTCLIPPAYLIFLFFLFLSGSCFLLFSFFPFSNLHIFNWKRNLQSFNSARNKTRWPPIKFSMSSTWHITFNPSTPQVKVKPRLQSWLSLIHIWRCRRS